MYQEYVFSFRTGHVVSRQVVVVIVLGGHDRSGRSRQVVPSGRPAVRPVMLRMKEGADEHSGRQLQLYGLWML